jgi:hypothetical protein
LIFDYPPSRSTRRHGPGGYSEYERYRPWLRDEFDFRCVYCLERETWTKVVRAFEVDHVAPVSRSPERALDYENLVYACARCNGIKSDQSVPDPFLELNNSTVRVGEDGIVTGQTRAARLLIRQLDLNSPTMIEWRRLKLEFEQLAQAHPGRLRELTALPTNLPDLSKLRPKSNSRPKGIKESWFERM